MFIFMYTYIIYIYTYSVTYYSGNWSSSRLYLACCVYKPPKHLNPAAKVNACSQSPELWYSPYIG